MSDSDSEIAGSNPVRAALGHSYNGYYSGLLIRQIRVRIPDGPFNNMAPSSKQVRTLVSPSGSVVAERVPKGTQQPFKAEMSGSNPVGAAFNAPSY